MRSLELLHGFVKVYDAIKKGEDFGGESCHVAHCPIVGVDDGEDIMHPAGVDKGPGHEGEEGNLMWKIRKWGERLKKE